MHRVLVKVKVKKVKKVKKKEGGSLNHASQSLKRRSFGQIRRALHSSRPLVECTSEKAGPSLQCRVFTTHSETWRRFSHDTGSNIVFLCRTYHCSVRYWPCQRLRDHFEWPCPSHGTMFVTWWWCCLSGPHTAKIVQDYFLRTRVSFHICNGLHNRSISILLSPSRQCWRQMFKRVTHLHYH